jgi:hypothetical protein
MRSALNEAYRSHLPVAVLGAGPIGLAAAANLIERNLTPVILEAGIRVGAHLLEYGHVRLFSPSRYNVDPAIARLLGVTRWQTPPPEELPLAREIVERVLEPFVALPALAEALHLNTKVVSVSRDGFDKVKTAGREAAPFVIRAVRQGEPWELRAGAVIDATGTWRTPNPLGANGLLAPGEPENAGSIFYGIPDLLGGHRSRYAGKRVLVVGAGHSAANVLIALPELAKTQPGTTLAWAVRSLSLERLLGGQADALPARGELGVSLEALRTDRILEFIGGLRIGEVRRRDGRLEVMGADVDGRPVSVGGIDEIICATGQRPDLSITSELRVKLDPWLESTEALGPLIDPNVHSCGTVRPHGHRELAHPERGLYTVGVKSYGRAPTFLMTTGYEQARSVVAAIAGNLEAADRVELSLPETGVCSTRPSGASEKTASCCTARQASQNESSCCAPAPEILEGLEATPCCTPATEPAEERTTACCR